MTRLIWKEVRSSVWIIIMAAAILALALIWRDTLWFRAGGPGSGWFVLAAFPMLLMGLNAYSDELAHGTVDFLFSKPVNWWKVWLSKLLSGIIVCACLTVFAAVLYVALMPALYKPLFYIGLPQGMLYLFGTFFVAYATGFIVSILLPGIALSFAAIFGTYMFFGVLNIILGVGDWPLSMLAALLGMLAANLLIARRMQKFTVHGRLLVWGACIAAGMAASIILSAAGVDMASWPHSGYSAESLSPDGRWAVYRSEYDPGECGVRKIVFMDTSTGRMFPGWSGDVSAGGWSPDSPRYAAVDYDGYEVRIASMAGGAPRIDVLRPPRKITNSLDLCWSPDGKQLAIAHVASSNRSYSLAVVDVRQRKFTIKDAVVSRMEDIQANPGGTPELVSSLRGSDHQITIYWPPAPAGCR